MDCAKDIIVNQQTLCMNFHVSVDSRCSSCFQVAHHPDMMTMRLKEQFVSVWRICEDSDTLAHLLCPRNVLLLSQSRHAAAKVWMCLAGLLVHLLSCGVLQPDSLEQQCMAVLQSAWPQVCNVILMQPRTVFHQTFKGSICSYWMILLLVGWLKHEGVMGVIGIINWPTTWNKLLFEKLLVVSLGKKLPASYGTWRFFTILTQACLWPLSWTSEIQCTFSYSISLRSITILSCHLCLDLPGGLCRLSNQNSIFLHLIILKNLGKAGTLWSSLLYNFVCLPNTSFLVGFLSSSVDEADHAVLSNTITCSVLHPAVKPFCVMAEWAVIVTIPICLPWGSVHFNLMDVR